MVYSKYIRFHFRSMKRNNDTKFMYLKNWLETNYFESKNFCIAFCMSSLLCISVKNSNWFFQSYDFDPSKTFFTVLVFVLHKIKDRECAFYIKVDLRFIVLSMHWWHLLIRKIIKFGMYWIYDFKICQLRSYLLIINLENDLFISLLVKCTIY